MASPDSFRKDFTHLPILLFQRNEGMAKGADPSSGISLGDALRLPKRHPACRRREAQSGSCTERENLAGDAKGKSASGHNREAESTDAPERGGLLRISEEAG